MTYQCAIKTVANHRGGSQCFGPGQPGPQTPHFYRQEPLTFIDRALASPAPQPLTFIDRAQASLAPTPSLLSTGPRPARPPCNPSLLLARPAGPTPHFYWPTPHCFGQAGRPKPSLLFANPSLLLARPLTSISQAWPAQPLTFINRAWASPAPNPSLLSTGPGPQPLTFIDRARPQPLTFIDRAWPQPLTFIGRARHKTLTCG